MELSLEILENIIIYIYLILKLFIATCGARYLSDDEKANV